jgi:O-methyltransferase involved in polyketide biosynthesis
MRQYQGVELTAYLVNESRARKPGLAADPLAGAWIPREDRPAVRELWEEFAGSVYPYDDLVVSLRGRFIVDTLRRAVRAHPDLVLVVCGAGFSSYPWLLPVRTALEVDLPDIVEAKRRRVTELAAAGVLPEREVRQSAADLGTAAGRAEVAALVGEMAAGRPVAYVAEGLVFYLPPPEARAVVSLGAGFGSHVVVSAVSYWPEWAAGHQVLDNQRRWFSGRSVPTKASYLGHDELPALLTAGADPKAPVEDRGPEELQRRYLDRVVVGESELIPEYVAVAWAAGTPA